tara:strand:- start:6627 stop:6824 length:198 start_codon:yes stop_codon:yes gene_type:complete
MGNEKEPWKDIPIEIIIEEEERRREKEEKDRPRIELPIYHPSQSSSYDTPQSEECEEESVIIIKL